jgi:hypothetical protein
MNQMTQTCHWFSYSLYKFKDIFKNDEKDKAQTDGKINVKSPSWILTPFWIA